MREIILDTETTGLDPSKGDRIIEIGCVELIDHVPTGKEYQGYFNPDREISQQAFLVHGLSLDFLKKYPKFSDSVKEFLDFIKDSQLVMHNASFDLGFLNSELKKCEIKPIPSERTTDTNKVNLLLYVRSVFGFFITLLKFLKREFISPDFI